MTNIVWLHISTRYSWRQKRDCHGRLRSLAMTMGLTISMCRWVGVIKHLKRPHLAIAYPPHYLETKERSPRSDAPSRWQWVDYLNVQVGWVGVIKHLQDTPLAIAYPPHYLETKERSPRSDAPSRWQR